MCVCACRESIARFEHSDSYDVPRVADDVRFFVLNGVKTHVILFDVDKVNIV